MSYSIVYSSQTGNTKQLAETLRETLPQEGCRYFGTPAEAAAEADTLYVGDSGVDMETARRACVDSVGVSWGFRPVKELTEYRADTIINSPAEILPIVESGIPLK